MLFIGWLHTDWGKSVARGKIVAGAREAIAGRVSIGALEGSLLGTPTLKSISLRDPNEQPVLDIETLSLDLSLWDLLLSDKVRISSLKVKGAHLSLALDEHGRLNLAQSLAAQGPQEPSSAPIDVRDIRITQSSLSYEDTRVELSLIDIARLDSSEGRTSIDITKISGALPHCGGREFSVIGELLITESGLQSEGLHLVSGESEATVSFSMSNDLASLEMELAGTLDQALLECLAPEVAWRSHIVVQASAHRAQDDAEIAFNMSIADGAITIEGGASPELDGFHGKLAAQGFQPNALIDLGVSAVVKGELNLSVSASLDTHVQGHLSAVVDNRLLELDELRIDNVGTVALVALKLKAFEAQALASVELDWAEGYLRNGSLSAKVSSLETLPGLGELGGSLETALRFEGPMDSIHLNGAITGQRLRLAETQAARAVIEIDLSDLPSSLAGSARVDAAGVTQGRERIGPLRAELESNPDATEFAFSLRAGRRKRLWTNLSATAKRGPSGVLILLKAAHLEHGKLSARLRSNAKKPAAVFIGDDDVVLKSIRLALAKGQVDIDGAIGRSIEIAIRGVELGPLLKLAPGLAPTVTGRIAGTASISLSESGTSITTKLSAKQLRLDGSGEPLRAEIEGSLTPRDVSASLSVGGVKSGVLKLKGQGRVPRGRWNADALGSLGSGLLEFEEFDLQSVRSLHPQLKSLQGRVSGELKLSAGVASVVGTLRFNALSHKFWPSKVNGNLEIDATNKRVEIKNDLQDSRLGSLGLELRIEPPQPLHRLGRWQFSAGILRDTDLSFREIDLLALHKRMPQLASVMPSGSLSGRIRIREEGTSVALQAAVADLKFTGRPKASARVNATIESGTSKVDWVFALNSNNHLRGEATADVGLSILEGPLTSSHLRQVGESMRFAATTQFVSNSPALLSQTAGIESDVAVSGDIRVKGSANGTYRAPEAELEVEIEGATVDGVPLQRVTLAGSHKGNHATVSLRIQQAAKRYLSAGLEVDVAARSLKRASAVAKDIDLRLFRALDTKGRGMLSSLAGIANGKLDVSGTWANPDPRGWFNLSNASIELGNSLVPITKASLEGKIKDKQVTLALKGRSGRGSIGIRGSASLRGQTIENMAAQVQAAELPIMVGDFVYSADLSASAELEHLPGLWDIRTTINKALIRVPVEAFGGNARHLHSVDGMDDLVYLSEKKKSDGKKELAKDASLVRVKIRAKDSIAVRSRELSARVGLDLVTTFVGSTPLIAGSARVVKGHLDLFERRYQIERATVSFHQRTPINPSLDLKLRHDFEELSLGILATGELADPKIDFNADPSGYDQTTLLAIFLGQSPAQHENEQGLRDNAIAALSTLAANKLQDALSPLLPIDIDVVRVEKTDNDGELYTVGEWLSDRWFVAWRHRSLAEDLENNNEVESRYKLSKRWSLEGKYGDRDAGGVDMLWTKRWGK